MNNNNNQNKIIKKDYNKYSTNNPKERKTRIETQNRKPMSKTC